MPSAIPAHCCQRSRSPSAAHPTSAMVERRRRDDPRRGGRLRRHESRHLQPLVHGDSQRPDRHELQHRPPSRPREFPAPGDGREQHRDADPESQADHRERVRLPDGDLGGDERRTPDHDGEQRAEVGVPFFILHSEASLCYGCSEIHNITGGHRHDAFAPPYDARVGRVVRDRPVRAAGHPVAARRPAHTPRPPRRPASPPGTAATQVGGQWAKATPDAAEPRYAGGKWIEVTYGRPILRGRDRRLRHRRRLRQEGARERCALARRREQHHPVHDRGPARLRRQDARRPASTACSST